MLASIVASIGFAPEWHPRTPADLKQHLPHTGFCAFDHYPLFSAEVYAKAASEKMGAHLHMIETNFDQDFAVWMPECALFRIP